MGYLNLVDKSHLYNAGMFGIESFYLLLLHKKILNCYNVSLPIKTETFTFEDQSKLWINATFKLNVKKGKISTSLYWRNLMSEREYKCFRNLVNNQNRMAKRQYCEKNFCDNKQNLKKNVVKNYQCFAQTLKQ